MARRRRGKPISGWINLDKPAGMTSTEALNRVKRVLDPEKAGHAGTLDPLATGILPIALGEATKLVPYAQDALKVYLFTVRWGESRDTDDAEGQVIATSERRPSRDEILALLPRFTGEILQIPPKFSAIKVAGARAYDLARSGDQDFELEARPVYIERLDLVEQDTDSASFRAVTGKGTYVRSLARDMAEALETCGHISSLRREAVGPFRAETAISLDILENLDDSSRPEDVVLPLASMLDDIPALEVTEQEAARIRSGQGLSLISRPDADRLVKIGVDLRSQEPMTILATIGGLTIAIAEAAGVEVRPVRVLHTPGQKTTMTHSRRR